MGGFTSLKLLCVTALVGVMALVAAGSAIAGLPGEGDPLLPNTGNIRGTVVDENGVPAEHLEVCAMTESTVPTGLRYCSRTEEGGQYLIYDVPEGNYLVDGQAPWYLGEEPAGKENHPQVWYPDARHPDEATAVPVEGEGTTVGIDFRIHVGGEITGTVTDASTGAPIADVEACPVWVGVAQRGEEHPCAFTDTAGHYRIKDVDTDEYTVHFGNRSAPGYASGFYPFGASEPTPVAVVAGQVTEGIDGRLLPLGAQGGTTGSDEGAPGGSAAASPQTWPPVVLPAPHTRPRLNCRHGLHKLRHRGQVRCVSVKRLQPKYHSSR